MEFRNKTSNYTITDVWQSVDVPGAVILRKSKIHNAFHKNASEDTEVYRNNTFPKCLELERVQTNNQKNQRKLDSLLINVWSSVCFRSFQSRQHWKESCCASKASLIAIHSGPANVHCKSRLSIRDATLQNQSSWVFLVFLFLSLTWKTNDSILKIKSMTKTLFWFRDRTWWAKQLGQ